MRAAIQRRDPSFDGVFYYGVITTGVFCMPSCSARPARPENLRFYFATQDAMAAGLRPCKKCQPLLALDRRDALINLARYIEANPAERLTLTDLAQRADMSPSTFRRLFKTTFGVSPKAYQDAVRLRTFKTALHTGEGVAGAIFDAGFGSTSRVYGMAARNIGMTPSAYRAGAAGESIRYACRATELGSLMMAATPRGVCFAQFGDRDAELLAQLRREFPNADIQPSSAQDSPELDDWIDALNRHLRDRAPRPDLPLDLRGTAFQIRIWRYLVGIDEGDVISYGELARGIDEPKAVRAAATACGANRIAILIPCHRVLRGNGDLGGYRWGLDRKRALIDVERSRKASA